LSADFARISLVPPLCASGYGFGTAASSPGVAFAPDGRELAAACGDAKVRFWNPRGGERTRADFVIFPPRSLSYSTDGSKLLVTGRFGGGAAKVFLLGEGRRAVQAEITHPWWSSVVGGVFSADGSLVLTFAKDGTAHVWEAASGRPVAHRTGGPAAILDAAFDGGISNPRVIVARDDGTVSLWPVDPLPAARARMPRPLHPLEKERERRLALPLRFD
jgi:WD40 repeat protein